MKRQKELNEKTLNLMQKEVDRIKHLQNQIAKYQSELQQIEENNSWIRYLNNGFTDNATEEQQIEFSELSNIIKYATYKI